MKKQDIALVDKLRAFIADLERKSRAVTPGKRDCWKEVANSLRKILASTEKN